MLTGYAATCSCVTVRVVLVGDRFYNTRFAKRLRLSFYIAVLLPCSTLAFCDTSLNCSVSTNAKPPENYHCVYVLTYRVLFILRLDFILNTSTAFTSVSICVGTASPSSTSIRYCLPHIIHNFFYTIYTILYIYIYIYVIYMYIIYVYINNLLT